MDEKIALFVFNGDPSCIVHVMLNALDMKQNGYDVKIIFEGKSTLLIPELADEQHKFHDLYNKVLAESLVECVCKACAMQLKVYDKIKHLGLEFCAEMSGHPSIGRFIERGYKIITF